jgi:hypothetical protein
LVEAIAVDVELARLILRREVVLVETQLVPVHLDPGLELME